MRGDFIGYHCSVCGNEYEPLEVMYTCPKDGGNLDVVINYSAITERIDPRSVLSDPEQSIWRYLPLLPVDDPGFRGTPLRVVGATPIYQNERLSKTAGIDKIWLKDESCNPSGSLKDRASAVLAARAKEVHAEVIVTASTGNAGAALACMAAATGQKAVILAPKSAPPAKIAQLQVFGAQIVLIDGTYDDAFDLAVEASREFGWYCRNTGYNPFTAEGKKTASFEIWEQVIVNAGVADSSLAIFVSVGDGNIITGIRKGFLDLLACGWLAHMPKIFGVQANGSAAIWNAYHAGNEIIQPVHAQTIADSISVDLPRDGLRALRAATETGGAFLKVSDEQILEAIAELGTLGIFCEPAGAAAFAGMKQAVHQGMIARDEPVIVINTGSGLKDIRAVEQAVPAAPVIAPSLAELKKIQGSKNNK